MSSGFVSYDFNNIDDLIPETSIPKNIGSKATEKTQSAVESLTSNALAIHVVGPIERSYLPKYSDLQRLEAAKREIPEKSWKIPAFIRDRLETFSLTQDHRFEIAKLCCMQEPSVVGLLDCFQLSVEQRKVIALRVTRNDLLAMAQLPSDLRPCSVSLGAYERSEAIDWELETPEEIAVQLKEFVAKNRHALARSGPHHNEELALTTAIGAVDYWRLALTQEQFAWVSQQGFFQEIFELEAPVLRHSLIHSVVEIAPRKEAFFVCNLSDKIPKSKLLKLPLTHLLMEDGDKRSVLAPMMTAVARQLRDTKSFSLVWKTLNLLSLDTTLNPDQKTHVIQALCRDPNTFIRQITSLCIVLQCQQSALLQKDPSQELSLSAQEAFQAVVPFSKPLDFDRFKEVFFAYRHPDAMMLYASDLATLNKASLMESLASHIASVLSGTYCQDRYSLVTSPHLQMIDRQYPELIALWSQNAENISLADIFFRCENAESSRSWLQRNLIDEKLVEELGFKGPGFERCLQGEIEALELLKSELQNKGLEKAQQASFALQNKLLQLAKSSNLENSCRLVQELLQNNLIPRESEFRKRLHLKLEELKQEQLLSSYFVSETDNPEDLFLYGTELQDSCQAVGGNPEHSQGLLGSLHHGQTKLIAVKDRNGRIVARSIIRLLWDGERPVLFLEQLYNNRKEEAHFPQAIEAMARRCADRLSCPLSISDEIDGPYENNLQSEGGIAPEEYVDAAGGLCANGRYVIRQVKWSYVPSQLVKPSMQKIKPEAAADHFLDFDGWADEPNPYECREEIY